MVDSYFGKTFVAYLDISGFSEKMIDEKSAWNVLDKFYSTIYRFCEKHLDSVPRMSVILGSDEAIVFTRNEKPSDEEDGLLSILRFIKSVNVSFIDSGEGSFATTCSIAYGRFQFQNRSELDDLRKNFFFGSPYVSAVLDQKRGKPKIKPGDCGLLFRRSYLSNKTQRDITPFIIRRGKRNYFYWMLDDPDDHRSFDADYSEAYSKRKKDNYRGIIQVLRKYAGHSPNDTLASRLERQKR